MKKVKTKKILSALILAALVISLLPAASLPARADDKGNIVIPGSGTITQAIVNTALAGAGVGVGDTYTASFSDSPTAIGDNAFDLRTGLTGITFPASLQSIGDYAFISCASLTSITLPDGLQSIGKGAFSWCGLTSINIPQSVTAVDAELFWGSTDLANITVDSGSQYYMHIDGVLFSKNGETLVCYPAGKTAVSYLIPAGVETIGPYAFSYSAALKSVDFSASDVSILGDSAFARSGLTSISLPDSLKSIGSAAFEDCTDLQSVTIPGGLESIGVAAFRDCTGLTDIFMMPIVAPALVTSAFNNLPATAVVHARRGATGYDDTAWSGITVRHDLPENLPVIFLDGEGGEVTQAMADAALDGAPDEYAVAVYNADSIGAEAFMGQNGMWELVIAEGVTDIGDRAFWNCRDLVSMFFHGAPPTLGSEVFDYCPANMTLYYFDENESDWTSLPAGYENLFIEHISTIPGADECLITGFTVAGIQGVIDNELNRIMIATANQVIWGQLNEPLTAAISFSGGCTIDPLGSVEQSFKLNSVVYTVTSGDGALIRRYVVRLVFDEFGGGDDPPVVVPPVLDKVNHFAYMVGYPGGYVRPELPISRAETTTIFFRLLTQEHRAGAWKTANGFADTDSAAWYNNAVSTLSGMGVLKGYADGSFAPGASITRAEFAAIAVRFADMANISGSANPGGFTDISGHWAEAEIIRAAQLGYVRGDGNGLFRPDEFITRAEVVTMINRVLDRHVNDAADLLPGMMVWPDNTEGAWYYFDVQEATNSHYYTRKTDGINEKWTELRTAPDWTLLERPGAKPSDVSY